MIFHPHTANSGASDPQMLNKLVLVSDEVALD